MLDVREDGPNLRVSGYASTTNVAYPMGFYDETVKPGAFGSTLARGPDTQLLVNHSGLPLARTVNGSLVLREGGIGLHFDATLDPHDPDSARVMGKIRDGLLTECSFAFRMVRQTWDDDYTKRTILELDIHRGDVSIVNFGANANTSVEALAARRAALERELAFDLDYYKARAFAFRLREPSSRKRKRRPVAAADIYKARAYALRLRGDQ